MTTTKTAWVLLFLAPVLLAGCDPELAIGARKLEAARSQGLGPGGEDLCQEAGWYDDGVCDPFCPTADPDCQVPCADGCPAETYCINEESRCDSMVLPPGRSCAGAGDCLSDETCGRLGVCYVIPSCDEDSDCWIGLRCGGEGRCEVDPAAACDDDDQCQAPARCQNYGACAQGARLETCSGDLECGPGLICVEDVCTPIHGYFCATDVDCPPDFDCGFAGFCYQAECAGDGDCTDGKLCSSYSVCRRAVARCDQDGACPVGTVCEFGLCH